MIIVDSSELRPQSRLITLGEYYTSSILESVTGADVMVSSLAAPKPSNEHLIKYHISKGAKLIQLKFGHDLVASIIDGRFKESQSKMKQVGAMPWQCILMFVGVAHVDSEGQLMINNQTTYGGKFDYEWYTVQVDTWLSRGGSYCNEVSANNVWTWLEGMERALDIYTRISQKVIWPKAPALHSTEFEGIKDYIERLRYPQELIPVNDLRILYAVLPGIGSGRAQSIWDSGIRDIKGLLNWLEGDEPKIKGIGNKTKQKVRDWLNGH